MGISWNLAMAKGARVVKDRVTDILMDSGKPSVVTKDGQSEPYDLLVGAVGVNTPQPGTV